MAWEDILGKGFNERKLQLALIETNSYLPICRQCGEHVCSCDDFIPWRKILADHPIHLDSKEV